MRQGQDQADSAVIHFLADLHLSPDTPGIARLFTDYLAEEARAAAHIFILGDLFDAWPGDDLLDDPSDPFALNIAKNLRALRDFGTTVSILHGNRDFLLDEHFAEVSGAELLPDPYVLALPSIRFVLSHGDALCTDDLEYQAFRRQVRAPAWRLALLQKPLEERKAAAAAMRRQSEASKRERTAAQMDLNTAATEDFLRCHGHATFIHGHTHRPAKHEHIVDNIGVERWVLSDWLEERGEYLAWNGHALTRHALEA